MAWSRTSGFMYDHVCYNYDSIIKNSLQESPTGLPSIISEGVDEGQLASSKRGPGSLCSQQFFTEDFSCKLKEHLIGFHRNHSISHAGRKHLKRTSDCFELVTDDRGRIPKDKNAF
ncbi:hypothetical protein CAPTEDRAFT_203364 [Capitella teleta]|uniref:Uncharacterized protein n=1 Tax=Capitella teleta TaxID=283909 RepID=R7VGH3_CAPTE|nr:hypothetical protein CAPTEDRAFT_203364 [Capitella teleta]|eukprot:ELU15416.1 hypothetical protein CAPTEDRAFT_203364 [Capitella teleta]